jgi:hypothetical protein
VAYLVDSDWLIDHLAEIPEATELLQSLAGEGLFISVVSYMEAFQGTLRSESPDTALDRLNALSDAVLPMDIRIAKRCASLRQHFLDLGQRPTRRGFDLVIAATALEHDLTLATRNVRDYADIPDLKLYRLA